MLELSLGSLYFIYFSVPYFGIACDGIWCPFLASNNKKEKVLDRGQKGFLMSRQLVSVTV